MSQGSAILCGSGGMIHFEDLERIVSFQRREIVARNEQVEDLTRSCHKLEREKIWLEEALKNAELIGQDVAAKSRKLCELITNVEEDLAHRDQLIKELEELASNGDDLAIRVNELTKMNLKHERSMKSKQENKRKQQKESKMVGVMSVQTQDTREDAPNELVRNNGLVFKGQSVHAQNSDLNEDLERPKAMIEENDKVLSVPATKKCTGFEKKCTSYTKHVVTVNERQHKSENEISTSKTTNDNLHADVEEDGCPIERMNKLLDDEKKHGQNEGGFHDDDVEKKWKTPQQESDAMCGRNTSHVEKAKSLSEIEQKEKFWNGNKNYSEVKFDSNKCGLTVNVNGPHAQVIFRDVKINEK